LLIETVIRPWQRSQDSAAPSGEDAAVIALLELVDLVDGVDPHPLKNSEPGPRAIMGLRMVMIGLARGMTLEAAAGPAVELMLDRGDVGATASGRQREGQGRPEPRARWISATPRSMAPWYCR
jgi:hypothetical protein